MPPKASPYCRVEGCGAPRHIYPSGIKCQYCQAHMRLRKAKQRTGHATMTGQMLDILRYLSACKAQGFQFAELCYPFAHGTTIKGLVERDWIFASVGLDGVRYCITGRGEDALHAYKEAINRRDGICPKCGERPRHVRRSGKVDAFCLECLHDLSRRRREVLKNHMGNLERPCSRCHKRPRHRYAGGEYSTYCRHCERVNRRCNQRKQRRRTLKAVQAGGPVPLCKKCKAAPCRVYPNSISNYCLACKSMVQRRQKLARTLRRAMA